MNKKWLEIRNQAEITEIFINGDIENDAHNDGIMEQWFGLKDTNTYPLEVKKALDEADNKEVHVHINSYGGEVFAGVAICNMLKNYKGKTVAYVDGLAASAASIIAFGCDEVIIPNNAYLMIHRVSCGVFGNADDLRTQIEVLEKLEDGIANTYEEKAVEGVTKEEILNLMKEETWFTGKDAVKYFNITLEQGSNFVNYVGTNQKFKNIPKEIINKTDHKNDELKAKEVARLENLSKEIDITLALGGI
ncbi:head maturation protease, ClpP-related [Fusobacterium ulcerans]|uniref:head maturation protease, ClpP-related n=1 Tax=Fusobacterium ulcerans TaxID=861 RepID=UPI00102F7325|nr:head maturation protease, ClpP-related [Fusobacterium ulcerans]